MISDSNSDTQGYRPSLPDNILANYWSEDDICHSRTDSFQLDWAQSMMQNIDSKDNTQISDEQLNAEETPSSPSKQKKSKSKKSVTINERQNTNINPKSVGFGSNTSPSLLGSYNENDNQNNSRNITIF